MVNLQGKKEETQKKPPAKLLRLQEHFIAILIPEFVCCFVKPFLTFLNPRQVGYFRKKNISLTFGGFVVVVVLN